jgi:hypothetical protein
MKNLSHLLVSTILAICGLVLGLILLQAGRPIVVVTSALDETRYIDTTQLFCPFQAITVTAATLIISDTHPTWSDGRTIYFANHISGVITVLARVSDTCHVWGGAAFGRREPIVLTPTTGTVRQVVYPVSVTHGSTMVVLTSSLTLTGTAFTTLSHQSFLTFTQDITPPQPVSIAAPGHTAETSFLIQWFANDQEGSGVSHYTVTYTYFTASTGTVRVPWLITTSHSAIFIAPFTETSYTFQVMAYDYVGNSASSAVTTYVGPFRIYLPLLLRNHPPVWQQAGGTDGLKVYDVAICPDDHRVQYAGTAAGIYRSTDGGASWTFWALSGEISPVAINLQQCTQVFAAVWGSGVYSVTGQGNAMPVSEAINHGLDDLYLYSIVMSGTVLYAGTNSHGIYRTDTSDIHWEAVNNGLNDLRIRSLYRLGDELYAGSRQCTYYFSDDGGIQWAAESVLDGGRNDEPCADAQVWAITEWDGRHYAGLGLGKGLYQWDHTWMRVTDVPETTISNFGLQPYGNSLYVGTYGQGVYLCIAGGGCQPLPNGGLGELQLRGLAIADHYPRLLAASDDGIWWLPLSSAPSTR